MAVPPELISAFIGAAGGAGVAWLSYRAQAARERTQEIRDVLVKVVELRERLSELPAKPLAQQAEFGSLLNTRRALYLAIAEDLERKAGRRLTAHDYNILGYENLLDSDFLGARRYYERGLHKAQRADVLTQTISTRSLAAYFYAPGPEYDPDEGDRRFQAAVDLTIELANPYMLYTTGYTLEMWATSLMAAGRSGWDERLAEARRCYEDLPEWMSPLRETTLASLAAKEQQATQGQYASLPRLVTPTPPTQ